LNVLDRIMAVKRAEVAAALRIAHEAPWPEAKAAYTDVQDTGAGRWRG